MRDQNVPFTRDLVLVGGGHSHALLLRRWGMDKLPGTQLTLINPGVYATYSGMLPGYVAGHYQPDDLNIDLVRLARFAGARFINAAAIGIDKDRKRVIVKDRPDVAFDIASLDVGITSAMPKLRGFDTFGVPAKPLHTFAKRWRDFSLQSGFAEIVVLGAGVAGAELAMAMAHAMKIAGRSVKITLIDKGHALSAASLHAETAIRRAMKRLGIVLREHTICTEVTAKTVIFADGTEIASDFTVGTAAAQPHAWLQNTGLDLHEGFVRVDSRLRSSVPGIFAAGDCAHMDASPRPKAGVYAVRQAPVLFTNLRASLTEQGGLKPYRPQKDYLKLISLGGKSALADRAGMRLAGPALWHLKDKIDQAFMRKVNDLPRQETPVLPWPRAAGTRQALGDKPACGGCGSKIGAPSLRRALNSAGLTDLRDDAAVITTGGVQQVFTTDHLRALTQDPVIMARIAAIHALGDVWAMGAKPQAATISVTLPKVSAVLAERMLSEIMHAARETIAEAGARIVGGHSAIGQELTIGFAITGLAEQPITLAGARPGDDLILTKPLGTGVIMAADMALEAKGHWVEAALESMTTPLDPPKAHAMTDVTGFGLAGHLTNMCEASGCGAELWLDALPLLPGALELAQKGIRSTLYPENRAAVPGLPDGARADLLFDPQTAGGLLAAVPPGSEPAATRIGRVIDATHHIRCV